MLTTAGNLILDEILPPGEWRPGEALDSGKISELMTGLAKKLPPEQYVDMLQKLDDAGREAATYYGNSASIRLKDFIAPPEVKKEQAVLARRISEIYNNDVLNTEEKHQAVHDVLKDTKILSEKDLYSILGKYDNAMVSQIQSGSRGKPIQLRQNVTGSAAMYDSDGNFIPVAGMHGYGEGLSPMEYWSTLNSSRKGAVDVQLATARSGYLSRQLSNVAHRLIVTERECASETGGDRGLMVDGDDQDNVGAVLARDVGEFKAGKVLAPEDLAGLEGKKIMVHSPLTCGSKEGVCARCVGVRETGSFPEIGDAVGLNAVRTFMEPLTQAQLGAKHVGKTTEKKHKIEGFQEVNQFLQMPSEFKDGAVLSSADGIITKVEEAPQGGFHIYVGSDGHYVPAGIEVKVSRGDKVEAGDILSDGIPNPAEVVKYKGIGEGRRYFVEAFRQILDKNRAGTHRRNIELLARAFMSKVRVSDPDGLNGSIIDDIVDYDNMAEGWQPRDGSELKTVTTAGNLYLERPYLHYSIGTRVTPRVSEALKGAGVKTVLTNSKPPPFEPEPIRAQAFINKDQDWITRMAGEDLYRSLVDSASRGSSSRKDSTSYYPGLINIADKKQPN